MRYNLRVTILFGMLGLSFGCKFFCIGPEGALDYVLSPEQNQCVEQLNLYYTESHLPFPYPEAFKDVICRPGHYAHVKMDKIEILLLPNDAIRFEWSEVKLLTFIAPLLIPLWRVWILV